MAEERIYSEEEQKVLDVLKKLEKGQITAPIALEEIVNMVNAE